MSNPGNLSDAQLQNARVIVAQAKTKFGDNATGQQAAVIGIMAALQESGLQNLNYGDRDSLGLFQQRASWGSVDNRENPTWASQQFFNHLANVTNWQNLDYGVAAQAVQVSAYPAAYTPHQQTAQSVVNAIWGSTVSNTTANSVPGLSSILGNLVSPQFWQRFGIFALGSILIIFVLVKILSGTKAVQVVTDTVKGVADNAAE